MKKTLLFVKLLILGSLLVLLAVPSTILAGSPIGGSFVISAGPEQEVNTTVAYNSLRQEYLVVWYNDRPGCDDIRAQRLSKRGSMIGGPFYIAAECPADRRYPDVAYNSAHDQYLVVWEQEEASSGRSIKAVRVSGTGQILDPVEITIRDAGFNLYTPITPAVDYASTSDRYLVVWAETWHPMPIIYGVYGQVVTDSGSLDGTLFTISENSNSLEEPDVAYNRHANRYLVVWQQDAGALWDIHGQQVHGGGGLFQGDITIAYFTVSSTNPAVAAIPTSPSNDKFLVAFESQYAAGDKDILGQLVGEDGSLGFGFTIWGTGEDESSPAIASTEKNLQYFVTLRYSPSGEVTPIKGRLISYTGSLLDPIANFPGSNADYPAVAAGYGGDYLIAWQDQPLYDTSTNIYGQLVGNRIYIPSALRDHP